MAKIYNVEIEDTIKNTIDTYSIAIPYGECITSASTAAKTINSEYLSSITLEAGVQVKICILKQIRILTNKIYIWQYCRQSYFKNKWYNSCKHCC